MKTGWSDVALGDVAKLTSGGTPDKSRPEYYGGETPWITGADIIEGAVGPARAHVSDIGLARSAASVAETGTVLLVTRTGVGKVAVAPHPVSFSQDITAVVPDSQRLSPAYLRYFLRYRQQWLVDRARGATIKGVTREVVTSLRVPLPPLDEQLRIAGILDTADEVRTKRDATIAAWDSLSRSIFLDMFGNPRTNPKGWRKGTLGEIALFTGGGTPSRARSDYFSGAICWATSKDMKHEFLDDTQEHVTKEAVAGSAAKVVPIGTILVVVKSKVLMHRLPVAIARVETCFGQDLKGITPDSTLGDVHFVAAALRSGQRWLLDRARGANTEGLTLDHLRSFPMVLPPIELQREFAMHVGSITGTKQMAQKSLAVLDELFASIQHRAFSGAL